MRLNSGVRPLLMDTYDLYKDLYFHEMDRRDRLNSGLSFPVGLVTLLSGASLVMLKSANWNLSDWDKLLIILLATATSALLIASIYLIRIYWGHEYSHMPYAEDLYNYCNDMIEHYKRQDVSSINSQKFAKAKMLSYVECEFSKNAKFNARVNDRKSRYLFNANAYLIGAIVFLGLSTPLYLYAQSRPKSDVQRIEITNRSLTVTQQEEQKPQPPPAREPEPQPPPSRLIREHTEKPHRK